MSGHSITRNDPLPVGESPCMHRLRGAIAALSGRACTVLIRGESGTGKELIARHIHLSSNRRDQPFIAVDCTTLKDSLFESQLFGHVKGAFTGAASSTLGFIRSADGGTLFLDEIGELGLAVQARLLRCIQDRAVVPLGGTAPVPVDIRILAATHRDLQAMVRRGEFREDLYFRINVVQLTAPPLRERGHDVLMLSQYYLERFSALYGEPVKRLSDDAIQVLSAYSWPGNVRELANVMEQIHILSPGPVVFAADLPESVRATCGPRPVSSPEADIPTYAVAEKMLLARALRAARGNQTRAAGILQIDRRRLRRRLKLYGMQNLRQTAAE